MKRAKSEHLLVILATLVSSCSNSMPAPSNPPGISCSSESQSPVCASSDPAPGGTFTPLTGNNVMTVTVSNNCPGSGSIGCTPNVPFTSVTICTPGSKTQCQTINNILVDTGSYGLRIFGSLVTSVTPKPYTFNGAPVGECAQFGSANTWGSVQLYDVQLDGQTISELPVQQIDVGFAGGPPPATACSQIGSVTGPADKNADFNGILGVGLGMADAQDYYACASPGHCVVADVPLNAEVQNPVVDLTRDNNGILLEFPQVPSGGQNSATGYLAFGIGTQSNNKPSNWGITNVYLADTDLLMRTTYNSLQYSGFIDSGSNANFVPDCFASSAGFFAPGCSVNMNATNISALDGGGALLTFQIGNADALFGTGNSAFNNLVGTAFDYPGLGPVVDWGMSFHYGRAIFVGISGKAAAGGELGSARGPYWAY